MIKKLLDWITLHYRLRSMRDVWKEEFRIICDEDNEIYRGMRCIYPSRRMRYERLLPGGVWIYVDHTPPGTYSFVDYYGTKI